MAREVRRSIGPRRYSLLRRGGWWYKNVTDIRFSGDVPRVHRRFIGIEGARA